MDEITPPVMHPPQLCSNVVRTEFEQKGLEQEGWKRDAKRGAENCGPYPRPSTKLVGSHAVAKPTGTELGGGTGDTMFFVT